MPLSTSTTVHAALRQLADRAPLTVCVTGCCMAPLIEEGATVQVSAATRYWPGDVVVVRTGDGAYLVHRVIGLWWRRGRKHYLTQADAARRPDPLLPETAVLGRVSGGDCSAAVMRPSLARRCLSLARFVAQLLRSARARLLRPGARQPGEQG